MLCRAIGEIVVASKSLDDESGKPSETTAARSGEINGIGFPIRPDFRAAETWCQADFTGLMSSSPLCRQSPSCRQGLSRWRGGRYRVVNPDISDTADVVWVTEKGDSRDPFTKNHAGRTPAPQLLCNHDAQLPAGRG